MRRGLSYSLGDDGRVMVMPTQPQPEGFAYQNSHAMNGLGQHPQHSKHGLEHDPAWNNFNKLPAWYTLTILLSGAPGAPVASSVPIRPEPFILKRITWATNGDTPLFVDNTGSGSVQGRSVTVLFDDEFTKFLGKNPCLVSALFGDSQGYLDLELGMLFQGKQALSITLQRLIWPDVTTPAETRWDFCFQGIMLLPKGVNQSGSAG
jgi:hypothetical protein